MTVIDGIVILFLATFILRGFWKGLVKELFATLALCLGLIAAANYHHLAGEKLASIIHLPVSSDTLGFIAVYFAVWLAVELMCAAMSHDKKEKKLPALSRLTGSLISLARGVLVASLVFAWAEWNYPHNRVTSQNYLTPYLMQSADWCLQNAPFLTQRPPSVHRHSSPPV